MNTPETPGRIPDAEARAVWQRAIELQMSEDRAVRRTELAASEAIGFSVEEIVEAAAGAGIEPDHVSVALAERRLPDAEQMRRDRWAARWQRRLIRAPDALVMSAFIRAKPDRVLEAFDGVVARPAFSATLEDQVGPNPPQEGVLVYRIERPGLSSSAFHDGMVTADARVILLSARERDDGTVLRLRLPAFEHGVNIALAAGITGGLGTAGGYGGAAAGGAIAALVGTVSAPVLAAPIAVGALAGASLGLAAARGGSRWGRRRGEKALRRLLQVVAVEAERDAPAEGTTRP